MEIDTMADKNKFVSDTGLLFEDARFINYDIEVVNKHFGKTQ